MDSPMHSGKYSFNRGRGRGYQGRGRPFVDTSWRSRGPAIQPPSPKLGFMLAIINHSDLTPSTDDPKITNCTDIASYNWMNRKIPTVLIPGKPAAWTPLSNPIKLREDDGEYFRDQNAARFSSHPMLAAVEAILRQNPDFDTKAIDIVGCGSTLRNLLCFARGIDDKKFRIIVECVGSTVFFIRRENSPTQTIPDVRGYGHTFPEAYTTWDAAVRGSETHQRVIKYSFGGLKCLVRFEADGYHPDLAPVDKRNDKETGNESVDDLLSALTDTSVTSHQSSGKELTIESGGSPVPQSSIFDLKTRSIKKKDADIMAEELPRLWMSQISNMVVAFHKSGVFQDIQRLDARDRVKQWEDDQKDDISKFAALLKLLAGFARGKPDGRFELFHDEASSNLTIREVCEDVGKALPDDVEDRWILGNLG